MSVKIVSSSNTRTVNVGKVAIGGGNPIAVQSMCATRTSDIDATLAQIKMLQDHGADIIRLAVDNKRDAEALREIRTGTDACLSVDIQEAYRIAAEVAPFVEKIRYNPGHLHHEKGSSTVEKVSFIVKAAREHDCALRIGVNFGSLEKNESTEEKDPISAALESVEKHVGMVESLGFQNYVVSLKSSNPEDVVTANRKFSKLHPEIPLHLGVTEAGMLPDGEYKTRMAFEPLLAEGIGDTLRVSLTIIGDLKYREIEIGRKIIEDVSESRFTEFDKYLKKGLNIVSCPSCSRVENEAFVELAEKVKEATVFAADSKLKIAVMGCRVNGPGETDDADLGLWCAPRHVNLKKRGELLGSFSYEEILPRLIEELKDMLKAA